MKEYTHDELTQMHLEAFRAIAATRPHGHIVGATWFIRITPNGASLVTPYQEKVYEEWASGTWVNKEFTTAL